MLINEATKAFMTLLQCSTLVHSLFCFLLQGLVVPVMRNVENMNYAEIEKSLNELGEKVRSIHMSDSPVNIADF